MFTVLFAVSYVQLGFLVMDAPTTSYALWALLITTIGGLVGQWLDRQERIQHRIQLNQKIDQNTTLTQVAADEAKSAYSEANGLNEKIRQLTAQNNALLEIQRRQSAVAVDTHITSADTNATAHRIEDAVKP